MYSFVVRGTASPAEGPHPTLCSPKLQNSCMLVFPILSVLPARCAEPMQDKSATNCLGHVTYAGATWCHQHESGPALLTPLPNRLHLIFFCLSSCCDRISIDLEETYKVLGTMGGTSLHHDMPTLNGGGSVHAKQCWLVFLEIWNNTCLVSSHNDSPTVVMATNLGKKSANAIDSPLSTPCIMLAGTTTGSGFGAFQCWESDL